MNEFWMNRPVYITGATGLIGSWLVKRLIEVGADVVCLVRDWVPRSEFVRDGLIEKVRVVRGDICDQGLMERILGEYEIDTVFHLAAQTVVPIANRNPISTFESNIKGTWVLLEACHRSATVKQIVVASSDKAYGEKGDLQYFENMSLDGLFPYDVSKACADMIAQSFAVSFGLPVVISRCGNFFGGGDLNWNRIVPGTIRSALMGKRPIIRSDGKFIRDYFYVEDGVAAYMILAEQLAKNPQLSGEAFNFSTETPMDVLTLVKTILNIMNLDFAPDVRDEITHEIKAQYLSAEKARNVLGWYPLFSIEQGLKLTIDWYNKYFKYIDV